MIYVYDELMYFVNQNISDYLFCQLFIVIKFHNCNYFDYIILLATDNLCLHISLVDGNILSGMLMKVKDCCQIRV